MPRDDSKTAAVRESHKRLREGVRECRELVRVAQRLIERAHRVGRPIEEDDASKQLPGLLFRRSEQDRRR
jgi:hypothetical protein